MIEVSVVVVAVEEDLRRKTSASTVAAEDIGKMLTSLLTDD